MLFPDAQMPRHPDLSSLESCPVIYISTESYKSKLFTYYSYSSNSSYGLPFLEVFMPLRYQCYSNHIHFDIDLLFLQCCMTYILHIYLHTTYIFTHVHIHIHIISHIITFMFVLSFSYEDSTKSFCFLH